RAKHTLLVRWPWLARPARASSSSCWSRRSAGSGGCAGSSPRRANCSRAASRRRACWATHTRWSGPCSGAPPRHFTPGIWSSLALGWLALDRPAEARRAADAAETWASALQLPMAHAWADRASAAVDLQSGDAAKAAERALAAAAIADEVGAPVEAALSRTLAG